MKEAKNATIEFNQQDKKFDVHLNELAKTELAEIEAKKIEGKVFFSFCFNLISDFNFFVISNLQFRKQ